MEFEVAVKNSDIDCWTYLLSIMIWRAQKYTASAFEILY